MITAIETLIIFKMFQNIRILIKYAGITRFNIGGGRFVTLGFQGHSKLDNWGGGLTFIYSCSAQLISFEIDCFHGL